MANKRLERAASLVGLLLVGGSAWFLQQKLRHLDVGDVLQFLRQIPGWQLALTVGWAAVGYAVTLGYDLLALRYVGVRLRFRRIAFASFISGAFSNSVSLPILGVGGVRFRLYAAWGLSAERLARLIMFVGYGSWLGLLAISGAAFLIRPPDLPVGATVSSLLMRAVGALFVAAVLANLVLCARRPSVRIWRWTLPLPRLHLASGQVALGMGEWAAQAMLVYTLLPPGEGVSLSWFMPAYSAAMLVAMIGHVPAGLGVFDSGALLLMTPVVDREPLLGVLILYRLIYHLVPLILALLMLGGFELWQRVSPEERSGGRAGSGGPRGR